MSLQHTEQALILKLTHSGESYIKIEALGFDKGGFYCLRRISKKNTTNEKPDLFDSAIIQLEPAKNGQTLFVREYQVTQRRETIGQSYKSLEYASNFASLLAHNANHLADPQQTYQLVEHIFDAFAQGKSPQVIYLKALYRLLHSEGYPVRESWWPELPAALRPQTKEFINQPAPVKLSKDAQAHCQEIIEDLHNWLQRHSDLNRP